MKRDRLAACKLKSLRMNKGLSPEQLGYVAGVSGHTVRRIESTGAIPTPRVQFLLAQHFDYTPTEIWPLTGAGAVAMRQAA